MPIAAKVHHVLKCIQSQFAVEQQRAVVESLGDLGHAPDRTDVQNLLEKKLQDQGAPAGLFNIGNTCYANVALQALMSCTPFVGYLADHFDHLAELVAFRQYLQGRRRLSQYFTPEFAQVVAALLLLRSQKDSFSPGRFLNIFRSIYGQFVMGQQHDAQEFISCLLDRLHEELKYPVLQLAYPTDEMLDDDQLSSSNQSDYASCISLFSDEWHHCPEDETIVKADGEPLSSHSSSSIEDPSHSTENSKHESYGEASDSGVHSVEDLDEMPDLPNADIRPRTDSVLTTASSIGLAESLDGGTRPRTDSCMTAASCSSNFSDHPGPHRHRCRSHSHHRHIPRPSKIVAWRSIIQDLFYGDFAVSIECKNCGEVSTRYESFQMLEVSIPTAERIAEVDDGYGEEYEKAAASVEKGEKASRFSRLLGFKSSAAKRKVNLLSCIRNEFKPEQLTGDNKYRCDHCAKTTDAVKNIRVSKLPEILIIHLKRFKYESGGSFLGIGNAERKIHDLVDFPCDEPLDPSYFNVDSTSKYDLRCIVAHAGSTLSSGHYTSYVRTDGESGSKWYYCNDADVSEIEGVKMTDMEVYMLVYVRRDSEKAAKCEQLKQSLGFDASTRDLDVLNELVGSKVTTEDSGIQLVSKEWWSMLKWSNVVRRLSSSDLVCPHRLLMPGAASDLGKFSVPIDAVNYEILSKIFEGHRGAACVYRSECIVCGQLLEQMRPKEKTAVANIPSGC